MMANPASTDTATGYAQIVRAHRPPPVLMRRADEPDAVRTGWLGTDKVRFHYVSAHNGTSESSERKSLGAFLLGGVH